MRALIDIDHYRDSNVFARERDVLFHCGWQFAGFGRDLLRDGDYIVAEVGNESVLVRNFDGELKGFLNVCSHRFSAIRRECKGNGPLQCQYHGWAYDRDGVPAGIANIREFDDITDARRAELALEAWDVERCGEFVFVRKNRGESRNLRDWLGGAWNMVETFGSSLGDQIDRNRMEIDANWKVTVENTLESYHVRSVHPETFSRLDLTSTGFRFDDPHSTWKAAVNPAMQARLDKLARQLQISSRFEGYFHQLVFPALTLATTSGMTYAVQTFRPLSVRKTEFTSFVFAPRHENLNGQNQLLVEACRPAVEFNRAVFDEDRIVCGQVQRGIEYARSDLKGELNREEQRVSDFQRAWSRRMQRASADSSRPCLEPDVEV